MILPISKNAMLIAITSKNDAIWALDTWEQKIPMMKVHGHKKVGLFPVIGNWGLTRD